MPEELRVGSLFSGIPSAASTTDCTGLGFDTSSSVRAILGAAMCSPHGGRESPSGTTYVRPVQVPVDVLVPQLVLISSQADSPARTSPSPDNAAASPVNAPGSSMSSHESLALFDPDGFSSRTYPGCSPRTAVGTSESLLERWPTSGTAWRGGFSTHVSSECRSDEEGCSSSEPSLSEILQPPQAVPARYSLSARAAQGILRRAQKRGRELPSHLQSALSKVAVEAHEDTATTPRRTP